MQLTCLNEEEEHTLKSIVGSRTKNTGGTYLLSDADEQLLLNVTVCPSAIERWNGAHTTPVQFNQTVRIRSISIQSSNVAQAPMRIKLFLNHPSLGFDDVEDGEAAQEFELTEEQVQQGKRIPLRYVRFQSVNTLHVRKCYVCETQ